MFKQNTKEFLAQNGYLPLSAWSHFDLDHGNPAIEPQNCLKIRKEVKNKGGLYIYLKNDRVLYIGKAKSLLVRLKSHFHESFKDPAHARFKPWHDFFSSDANRGHVKIFWKEVSTEEERQIIEKMLEYTMPSEFMAFKNKKSN